MKRQKERIARIESEIEFLWGVLRVNGMAKKVPNPHKGRGGGNFDYHVPAPPVLHPGPITDRRLKGIDRVAESVRDAWTPDNVLRAKTLAMEATNALAQDYIFTPLPQSPTGRTPSVSHILSKYFLRILEGKE